MAATPSLSFPLTSSLPPKFPATKPGNPLLFKIQSQNTYVDTPTKISAMKLENLHPKGPNGSGDTGVIAQVYAWERDEMTRIRVKCEHEKAAAARCKLDKTERELERRRVTDCGAKVHAEERRRKAKIKEKANKIRKTEKTPGNTTACFCFETKELA